MLDDDVLGDELADALDDGGLTAASIATALTARGYDIAEYTLARHRRGRCRGTR